MRHRTGIIRAGLAAIALTAAAWGWGSPGAVPVAAAEETAGLTFSAESGVYAQEFDLTLSAGGDTIYYTMDGSNPADDNSTREKYTAPIPIRDRSGDPNVLSAIDPGLFDSANVRWDRANKKFVSTISPPEDSKVDKITVVRAVSQDSAGNYSEVQTHTYFVGEMADHIHGIKESCEAAGMDLSIMSIAVQKEDFFDPERGIYVHGNIFDKALEEYLKRDSISDRNATDVARSLDANYKQKGKDWERPAHVDYFESNGETTELKLGQDCGIRIQGNYSRSDLQKSLRLYAREDYGQKNFKYEFFGDIAKNDNGETIGKYKKLTLRNGGNCAFTTKFSDAYWQSLIRDLNCENQASRACVVYLNGEYWGIYILQEEYDNNYFEETHGVNKDNVVIYKGDAESEAIGYKLDEGELPAGETDVSYYFRDLLEFFQTHENLDSQEDYDAFAQLVDVDSVRDYFAVNVWINNKWDWPGKNWSVWKVTQKEDGNPYGDGRWRFCFYDMDFGGVSGASDAGTNTMAEDNYKEYGLLDTSTSNPVVLMFAYCMTNDTFRADFANTLTGLSENNFKADTAIAVCDQYRDTYKPLYDQFFARYNVEKDYNANNSINGGYASHACIVGFVQNRAQAIPNILSWTETTMAKIKGSSGTLPTSPTPSAPAGEQPSTPPSDSPTMTPDPGASPVPDPGTSPVPDPGTSPVPDPSTGSQVGATDSPPTCIGMPTVTCKLKVTAKKGKKQIKVVTNKKAKVTVTVSRKIIKKGKKKVKTITYSAKKNKKGKIIIKLANKLKKKDKITVTASKSLYIPAVKNIKIK